MVGKRRKPKSQKKTKVCIGPMKRTSLKPTQRRVKRNKGKARDLQHWVAKQVSSLLDIPVERDGEIESRQMGQAGVDVVLRGNALERFPAAIECGSGESISWLDKVRQARKYQQKKKKAYQFWLVFLKRKEFKNPVVILDAKVFFEFIQTMYDLSARRIRSDNRE